LVRRFCCGERWGKLRRVGARCWGDDDGWAVCDAEAGSRGCGGKRGARRRAHQRLGRVVAFGVVERQPGSREEAALTLVAAVRAGLRGRCGSIGEIGMQIALGGAGGVLHKT